MTLHRYFISNHGIAVTLAMVLLTASGARASVVSFTGGFTSFRGPVTTAPGVRAAIFRTEINGVPVFADEALPGGQFGFERNGVGLKNTFSLRDTAGNPIPTVEFSFIVRSLLNPNSVTFTPSVPKNVQVGSEFTIGTFGVANGSWFGNSPGGNFYPDTDFGFTVTTHSSDALLDGHTFSDMLRFVVTAPDSLNATIQDDADYFYFVDHRSLGTISVFEANDRQGNPNAAGNTGTLDLNVRIGSLIPTGFINPTGAAFVGSQVISSVPEPGTGWFLMVGLVALVAAGKRRRTGVFGWSMSVDARRA